MSKKYEDIESTMKLIVKALPKDKESENIALKSVLTTIAGVVIVKLIDYISKK